jgi:dimethylaniline monooxygenase (N-oxide forming)
LSLLTEIFCRSNVRPPNPDYNFNENTKKIKPLLDSFFWSNTPPAFLKKESPFFNFVKEGKQLHVHRAEATSLSDHELQLSNGDTFSIDALVFATGWHRAQSSKTFSFNDCISLGLPIPLASEPDKLATKWGRFDRDADEELKYLFPLIASPPQTDPPVAENTPYRMYRHIVSPELITNNDRTITFLSIAGTAHTVTYAEISALWAVAWMEGLYTPTMDQTDQVRREDGLEKEVALVNAFLRHRYLSSAKRTPAFLTEAQTVFDTLVRDMGLEPDRRKGDGGLRGRLREYLTPYECSDYSGIVQELLAKHKKMT